MGKKKKKLEFSKIVFLCTSALFTLVVIGSFVLMWHVGDTSALVCLISTTGAMVTSCLSLYLWKARAENLLKIRKSHNLTIEEVKSLSNTDSMTYDDTTYNGDVM